MKLTISIILSICLLILCGCDSVNIDDYKQYGIVLYTGTINNISLQWNQSTHGEFVVTFSDNYTLRSPSCHVFDTDGHMTSVNSMSFSIPYIAYGSQQNDGNFRTLILLVPQTYKR